MPPDAAECRAITAHGHAHRDKACLRATVFRQPPSGCGFHLDIFSGWVLDTLCPLHWDRAPTPLPLSLTGREDKEGTGQVGKKHELRHLGRRASGGKMKWTLALALCSFQNKRGQERPGTVSRSLRPLPQSHPPAPPSKMEGPPLQGEGETNKSQRETRLEDGFKIACVLTWLVSGSVPQLGRRTRPLCRPRTPRPHKVQPHSLERLSSGC